MMNITLSRRTSSCRKPVLSVHNAVSWIGCRNEIGDTISNRRIAVLQSILPVSEDQNRGEIHEEFPLFVLWKRFSAGSAVQLYDVLTASDGYVLIFGLLSPLTSADLPDFVPNDETSELVVVHEPTELAFPLHNQAATRFWASQGESGS